MKVSLWADRGAGEESRGVWQDRPEDWTDPANISCPDGELVPYLVKVAVMVIPDNILQRHGLGEGEEPQSLSPHALGGPPSSAYKMHIRIPVLKVFSFYVFGCIEVFFKFLFNIICNLFYLWILLPTLQAL